MKIELERECGGYTYTAADDSDRSAWSVTTDYTHGKIYLNEPHDEDDMNQMAAFGRAIVKACRDMKREMRDNRFDV